MEPSRLPRPERPRSSDPRIGPVGFGLGELGDLPGTVPIRGLWLWGDPRSRPGLLLTFCAAELALGLNQVTAAIWYHPRPFAIPIGRTLIEHAPDSSFPSDHVTFLIASGLGLLAWTRHRGAGFALLALSVPVAWARLFLGVHFPLDMVGAIPVACLGLLIAAPFRTWVFETVYPRYIDPIYKTAFSRPIQRRWVRA